MRLIDADELLKYIPPEEMCSRFAVENALTVDAVPVIRCKDCKWLGVANLKDKYGQPNPVACCRGNGNVRIGIKPDDYCSRAERVNNEIE